MCKKKKSDRIHFSGVLLSGIEENAKFVAPNIID
jgi:hypothetical protein